MHDLESMRKTTIRGKDGKFMSNWRDKLVKQLAAQSRANIERANTEHEKASAPETRGSSITKQTYKGREIEILYFNNAAKVSIDDKVVAVVMPGGPLGPLDIAHQTIDNEINAADKAAMEAYRATHAAALPEGWLSEDSLAAREISYDTWDVDGGQ